MCSECKRGRSLDSLRSLEMTESVVFSRAQRGYSSFLSQVVAGVSSNFIACQGPRHSGHGPWHWAAGPWGDTGPNEISRLAALARDDGKCGAQRYGRTQNDEQDDDFRDQRARVLGRGIRHIRPRAVLRARPPANRQVGTSPPRIMPIAPRQVRSRKRTSRLAAKLGPGFALGYLPWRLFWISPGKYGHLPTGLSP